MFKAFADWLVYDLLAMTPGVHLTESIHFFVYDTLKIIFLLTFMVFTIGFIRSFFPPERVKALLGRVNGLFTYVAAAVLGVLSPFCSCSTVPIFIGFVESGIPLGVTFTFLLTSPIVNEIALGFLLITFGPKIAMIYTLAGMTIGIIAGYAIERFNLYHLVEPYVFEMNVGDSSVETPSFKTRVRMAWGEVRAVVSRVWLFIVIGIGLGALIHGYVPEDFLVTYAGPNNPLAVFVAVGAGIPLYSNAVGTIPIVEVLIQKGVGVGTALVFMMSVVALSLPEMLLLKQVIKPKLIGIFVGISGTGMILVGVLFNAIL